MLLGQETLEFMLRFTRALPQSKDGASVSLPKVEFLAGTGQQVRGTWEEQIKEDSQWTL